MRKSQSIFYILQIGADCEMDIQINVFVKKFYFRFLKKKRKKKTRRAMEKDIVCILDRYLFDRLIVKSNNKFTAKLLNFFWQ